MGFEQNVRGKHLKTSQLGKSVCTNRPRTTSGIDSRTSLGGGLGELMMSASE
jgi:hypothetical protein